MMPQSQAAGAATLLKLACLLSAPLVAHASAMAAWFTDVGPQIIAQNPDTGDINHSWCNSSGTPVFATTNPPKLPVKTTPKKHSSVAASGWWNGTTVVSENNDLVHEIFACDMTKGEYQPLEQFPISGIDPSPNEHTGLAVDLLGDKAGYRLFYHASNRSIHYLTFNNNAGWSYGGVASPDIDTSPEPAVGGMAISTAFFLNTVNMTVVVPKDDKNMEVSMFNSDNSWHISTFPTPLADAGAPYNSESTTSEPEYNTSVATEKTLPGWTGKPKALGVSVDKDLTRYIFYIGSDKALHLFTSTISGGKLSPWGDAGGQKDPSVWPLADEEGSDFALASNPASYDIGIVYRSQGVLTWLNQSTSFGDWKPAIALPAVPPVNTTDAGSGGGGGGGLSTGQKAGIGVGVGVGALILGALAIGACIVLRRRRQQERVRRSNVPSEMMHDAGYGAHQTAGGYQYQEPHPAGPYTDNGTPAGGFGWGDKKTAPANHYDQPPATEIGEMPSNPIENRRVSELPSGYQVSHELAGDDRVGSPVPVHQDAAHLPSTAELVDSHHVVSPDRTSLPPTAASPQPSMWSAGHASPAPAYISPDVTGSQYGTATDGFGTQYQVYYDPPMQPASPPPAQSVSPPDGAGYLSQNQGYEIHDSNEHAQPHHGQPHHGQGG